MNFWETYEKLCSNIGKKPTQVGRELSISPASVTQWKNGSIPGGEKLVQIADYFNVTTDYLLGRTEEVPAESVISVSYPEPEEKEVKSKPDGMTSEFFKVFETLDWADKLDTMNFVRDKVRKSV